MKTFKEFISEEGYDRLRDQGRIRPSKDKKDATTLRSLQAKKWKRHGRYTRDPSALELVKKKYGIDVMDIGKN